MAKPRIFAAKCSIVAVVLICTAAVLVNASTAPNSQNPDGQDDVIRLKRTVHNFNERTSQLGKDSKPNFRSVENARTSEDGDSGSGTVQLQYRLRGAPSSVTSVAINLGYSPMIEIPPKEFLQRDTDPWTPNLVELVNAARVRIGGPNPENYTGCVQADYENFHELRGNNAAESLARRLSVISALRDAFPQAKIGSYGVIRLISGEPNSFMSQLLDNVDYFNVVCYRKGEADSDHPSEASLQKFINNLAHVSQFDKPVVATISPMWFDRSSGKHPMELQDWDETLQAIYDANVNLFGLYVWSNAIKVNQNEPQRIMPSMTDQELVSLQIEFLTHTHQIVSGWSFDKTKTENDRASNSENENSPRRSKHNMELPTFSSAYD